MSSSLSPSRFSFLLFADVIVQMLREVLHQNVKLYDTVNDNLITALKYILQKVNALIKVEVMFLQLLSAAVEDTLMWASGVWIDSVDIYLFISL